MTRKQIRRIILSFILVLNFLLTLTYNDRNDETIYLCHNAYEI